MVSPGTSVATSISTEREGVLKPVSRRHASYSDDSLPDAAGSWGPVFAAKSARLLMI
jgi:hypothetical protein